MEDLIERGLDPNRTILVVIDCAKALRRAVLDTSGARALLQHCQAHKKRNVLESLPERLRASVRATMNQAYAGRDPKRAHRLLENLAHKLESAYAGAAASLREGLDETLTVMGLHLSAGLERVLSSTNLIENLFSRVREIARRVQTLAGRDHDFCAGPPPACSKPNVTSVKSLVIAHCRGWPPSFTPMTSRSMVHASLKMETELPK